MIFLKRTFFTLTVLFAGGLGFLFLTFLYNYTATSIESDLRPDQYSSVEAAGGNHLFLSRGAKDPTALVFTAAGSSPAEWETVATFVGGESRIIIPERPGYGVSEPSNASRSTANIVAETNALLDAARIGSPLVLVGDREGAAFALAFASANPERVSGLVLLNPAMNLDTLKQRIGPAGFVSYADPMPSLRIAALRAVLGLNRLFRWYPYQVRIKDEQLRALFLRHISSLDAFNAAADELRINFTGAAEPLSLKGIRPSLHAMILTSIPADEREINSVSVLAPARKELAEAMTRQLVKSTLIDVPSSTDRLHIEKPTFLSHVINSILYEASDPTADTLSPLPELGEGDPSTAQTTASGSSAPKRPAPPIPIAPGSASVTLLFVRPDLSSEIRANPGVSYERLYCRIDRVLGVGMNFPPLQPGSDVLVIFPRPVFLTAADKKSIPPFQTRIMVAGFDGEDASVFRAADSPTDW